MPVSRIAIGSPAEATKPDALKAALAEFISMVIFVFAGEGSGMAFSMFSFKFYTSYSFHIICLFQFCCKMIFKTNFVHLSLHLNR